MKATCEASLPQGEWAKLLREYEAIPEGLAPIETYRDWEGQVKRYEASARFFEQVVRLMGRTLMHKLLNAKARNIKIKLEADYEGETRTKCFYVERV